MAAVQKWKCPACTYDNPANGVVCQMCLTARAITNTTTSMTPSLLTQKWRSYGRSSRLTSLTVFSQQQSTAGTHQHVFSNYVLHPPLSMDIPECCDPTSLQYSGGRNVRITYTFSEKAIMACKAALFKDYRTFDKILNCTNSKEAKALGRQVSPFVQNVWDAYQCSIVRHVTIAKLGWNRFRSILLQTNNDVIAECTQGDWVWGCSLDVADPNVHYPFRWKGSNILGWSLMEARAEEQKRTAAAAATPAAAVTSIPVWSVPTPAVFAAAATTTTTTTTPRRNKNNPMKEDERNSLKFFANRYLFGPCAFGPLRRTASITRRVDKNQPDLSNYVKAIVEASFPEAKHMKGERGRKFVTRMLTDVYRAGLFMHGNSNSSVNRTVIPAFRHIVSELNKLDERDKKRVQMVRNLAEACQDCQQVQARVILRIYGDLTSQNQTFESQLKYSLVRIKESALQVLITKYHNSCDLDHKKVEPQHQRAHLWSGYVSLIGDQFGLDGIDAANGDRFLRSSLGVIRNVHNGCAGGGFGDDGSLKRLILNELSQNLCVKEWLSGLIGDINNQSTNADRMIDRSCIFAWASANMEGDFKHRIFYDDSRLVEYSDLDPKKPTDNNEYEPFLSPVVLVEMLVKSGLLKKK